MLPSTNLFFTTSACYLFINALVLGAEIKNSDRTPQLGDADFPRPSPSARHDQKVKEVRSKNYDVVMVGDSITHTLGELGGKYEPMKKVWNKHFLPLNTINLGTMVTAPSKSSGIFKTASLNSRNPQKYSFF